jgi:hypothetical protein
MATALDSALSTKMPSLPINSRVMNKVTGETPAQITAGELYPAMQERRGEELRLRQSIADTESQLAGKEQEQKISGLEQKKTLQETQATELRNLPERTNLNLAREELSNAAFVPTKENAQDIATIFSLVGIIGMAIGGGAKDNAYAAMAGMNGMLEGYKKGRADVYKRERDMFDKNLKALQLKVQTLQQELTEAIQLKQQDFKAGETAIEIALAKSGSDLLDLKRKKNGDMAMLETVVQSGKDTDSLVKMSNDQFKQEQDRKFKERELAQQAELKRAQLANTAEIARARLENQGQKVTQQNMMAQRAVNSLGGVASALESLAELPTGTTTGLLPNLQTKDGFLNYVRNNIGRKLSTNEAEMMNTVFTGIGRNLASIEASGAATGLTQLANQMQSGLYINEGTDDPYRVAIKLADIRRIATENIRPAIESGLMPEGQARTAEALVKRIEQAIPFTTIDVIRSARQPGAQTIGEQTSRAVGGGEGGGWSQDKEKRLRELQEKKAARETGR